MSGHSTFKDVNYFNLQRCTQVQSTHALTETHVEKEESTKITVSNGRNRKTHSVYHGGIKGENPCAGAGPIIEESLQPHFTRISDRIVKANFKIIRDHQVNVIFPYAPTLKVKKTHKLERISMTNLIRLHYSIKRISIFYLYLGISMQKQDQVTVFTWKMWVNLGRDI